MTIKGITHDVTFPVKLEEVNGVIHANGKVTIDRTKWDVRYGSGKFFDNLADDTISDNIEFEMKIVAKKCSTDWFPVTSLQLPVTYFMRQGVSVLRCSV